MNSISKSEEEDPKTTMTAEITSARPVESVISRIQRSTLILRTNTAQTAMEIIDREEDPKRIMAIW